MRLAAMLDVRPYKMNIFKQMWECVGPGLRTLRMWRTAESPLVMWWCRFPLLVTACRREAQCGGERWPNIRGRRPNGARCAQMDINKVQLPNSALRRFSASVGACVAEIRSIRVDAAPAAMRSNHTLRLTAKRAPLDLRTYAAERESLFAVDR